MKLLVLFATAYLAVLTAKSQTPNSYVQVIEEDTLELEPDEIVFNVYVQDYPNDVADVTKSQSKLSAQKKLNASDNRVEKLYSVIKKMKIDTIPVNTYFIQNEIYGSFSPKAVYSLRFTSKEKLKSFISEVSDINGLAGYIAQLKSFQEQEAKNILTKKILKKADNDAKYIAQQSGRTLGELMSIQEENIEKSTGGWTMYPPLSSIAAGYFSEISLRDKMIISRRLVIKFFW